MPEQTRITSPGPFPGTVKLPSGEVLKIPADWELLAPGNPALTGRVKKAGPSWVVQEKRGNKTFSRGVWAPAKTIQSIREALQVEREDPAYERKLESARKKRDIKQAEYAEDFEHAVREFLNFAAEYGELARRVAQAIAVHAVGVGSGTVARTQRIPIEQRAEAATIAWLRHATTGYDEMVIPRQKGARREVRSMLARRSRQLLERYRRGEPIPLDQCALSKACG